jgi:hypothetical protein
MALAPWLTPQPQQTPPAAAPKQRAPWLPPPDVSRETPPPPQTGSDYIGNFLQSDIGQTIRGAPRRFVEGTLGAVGGMGELGAYGVGQGSRLFGNTPEEAAALQEKIAAPIREKTIGPEDVQQYVTNPLFGKGYEPTTPAGKKAQIVTDFLPNLMQPGPGWLKAAAVGVPAGLTMASEYLPERYQTLAKTISSLSGVPFGKPTPRAGPTRVRAAEEFGIPLTRGEATADVAQQKTEQAMIHGGKGEAAQRRFASHQEAVEAARATARENLTERMAPGATGTPMEAAENLGFTARRYVERQKAEGGALIDKALKEGVWVDSNRLNAAPNEIRTKLAGDTPGVPDVVLDATTPMGSKAMQAIDTFVQSQPRGTKEVSLAGAEQLRRTIGRMKATTPEDARALRKVANYYDDWMDAAVEGGVTRVGTGQPGGRPPAEVLSDLKAGRTKYRAGVELERPRKGEEGGTGVAKIVGETATPEEISRALAPQKSGQMSMEAPHTLSRLIDKFGADSDVVNNARSIVMQNLLQGGPQQTAGNLRRFMENSPTTAGKLFTPEQLDTLRRYQGVSESLVPAPAATQPSKSSYAPIAKMQKAGFTGGGAAIGAGVGHALSNLTGIPFLEAAGTAIGGGAGQLVGGVKNWMDVNKALQPLPGGWERMTDPERQRWLLAAMASGGGRRNE